MNIHILYNVCPILGSYITVAGSVAQHFQQHFFMNLKMKIHILYIVCLILGSYKRSFGQHSPWVGIKTIKPNWNITRKEKRTCRESLSFKVFERVAQHFYMTLKLGIHYIVYVCSFLGSYKSVAQHFQSVAQHILRKDIRKMKPLCVMAKCNTSYLRI